ncbi:hypothetical protein F4825DRAFT_451970 [Nemania diffusa]|nr:hypothetical protein F4825DRAFT_451970 [Nemania diffusa]
MSSTTYQSPYKPTPTSTQLDTFVRWLRLQKYQIEVTNGVYVYTAGEKAVFWGLFCFLFVTISATILLYTHRSLDFLVRATASYLDSYGYNSSLMSYLLSAKHAATRLTTSAQTGGADKAMEVMSSIAKNSQVA